MEGLVGDLEGEDEIAAVLFKPPSQPTKMLSYGGELANRQSTSTWWTRPPQPN
jgi:hypothetical protein